MPSPDPISPREDPLEEVRRSKAFRIAAVAICGVGLAGAALTLVRVAQDALDGHMDGQRQARVGSSAPAPADLPPVKHAEQPAPRRTEMAASPPARAPDLSTSVPDATAAPPAPSSEPSRQAIVSPAPVETPVAPVPVDPPAKPAETAAASAEPVPAAPPRGDTEPPPAAAQRAPLRVPRKAIRATPIPARALTVPVPPATAPALPPKATVPSQPSRIADAPARREVDRKSKKNLRKGIANAAPSQFRLVPTPPGFGPNVRAYSFVSDSGRMDGSGARVTVVRVR